MIVRSFPILTFGLLATLCACGGSGTTVSPPLASGASSPGASMPTATPSAPNGGAASAVPSPGTTGGPDLACDDAPFPSTTYTQCEATNYAMVSEANAEQASQPNFSATEATQGLANQEAWAARAAADPSWLSPESGDTAQTPACTEGDGPCVGNPFSYPDSAGPDGSTFYTTEATVTPFVIYDSQCARLSGRVWAPASSAPGDALPNIVIQNGSIEAPEHVYWWAAQALVRDGYVVMTFDPRGQGDSDEQTPTGTQGGNLNDTVFWTGLVDAIDFFRSSPPKPYPNNVTCKGTYPTTVAPYDPFWNRLDPARLGIAGHSLGATAVSIVQGYGGPGAAAWPGKIDPTNPVKVAVAWDGLLGPAGGDEGGIGNTSTAGYPKFSARVPSMGNSSEYGLTPTLFATPPPPDLHKSAYSQWVSAGTPVYEITFRGSTHYDFSLAPGFPSTSWCPDASADVCSNGWTNPASIYYTLAWFDRWLKKSGEIGYADADARLLDDNNPQGRNKMSFHFHSARAYPDRNGVMHVCSNIRGGCADTGLGSNARTRRLLNKMSGVRH